MPFVVFFLFLSYHLIILLFLPFHLLLLMMPLLSPSSSRLSLPTIFSSSSPSSFVSSSSSSLHYFPFPPLLVYRCSYHLSCFLTLASLTSSSSSLRKKTVFMFALCRDRQADRSADRRTSQELMNVVPVLHRHRCSLSSSLPYLKKKKIVAVIV